MAFCPDFRIVREYPAQEIRAELPSNGRPQRTPSSVLQSCTVARPRAKVFVHPVSIGDGEFCWTGFFYLLIGASGLRVHVFLEYTATDAFTFFQAPLVPSVIEGIRPAGGRWLGLQLGIRRFSDAVPSSLYSHSQRSFRPQPRGGGGDAAYLCRIGDSDHTRVLGIFSNLENLCNSIRQLLTTVRRCLTQAPCRRDARV